MSEQKLPGPESKEKSERKFGQWKEFFKQKGIEIGEKQLPAMVLNAVEVTKAVLDRPDTLTKRISGKFIETFHGVEEKNTQGVARDIFPWLSSKELDDFDRIDDGEEPQTDAGVQYKDLQRHKENGVLIDGDWLNPNGKMALGKNDQLVMTFYGDTERGSANSLGYGTETGVIDKLSGFNTLTREIFGNMRHMFDPTSLHWKPLKENNDNFPETFSFPEKTVLLHYMLQKIVEPFADDTDNPPHWFAKTTNKALKLLGRRIDKLPADEVRGYIGELSMPSEDGEFDGIYTTTEFDEDGEIAGTQAFDLWRDIPYYTLKEIAVEISTELRTEKVANTVRPGSGETTLWNVHLGDVGQEPDAADFGMVVGDEVMDLQTASNVIQTLYPDQNVSQLNSLALGNHDLAARDMTSLIAVHRLVGHQAFCQEITYSDENSDEKKVAYAQFDPNVIDPYFLQIVEKEIAEALDGDDPEKKQLAEHAQKILKAKQKRQKKIWKHLVDQSQSGDIDEVILSVHEYRTLRLQQDFDFSELPITHIMCGHYHQGTDAETNILNSKGEKILEHEVRPPTVDMQGITAAKDYQIVLGKNGVDVQAVDHGESAVKIEKKLEKYFI